MNKKREKEIFERIGMQYGFKDLLLDCVITGLLKPGSFIPEDIIRKGLYKRHKKMNVGLPLLQSDLFVNINGNLYMTEDADLISYRVRERLETKLYEFFRTEILPPQVIIDALKDDDFNVAKLINGLFVVFPAGL